MTQYARPDSDISTGSWTSTPLYQSIDEETASDADYIQSTTNSDTCEIGLSTVTDPSSSSNHIIKYRARKAGQGGLTVYLFDGTTQIASHTPTLTTVFADYSYTLTSGEADNISDYSDLRLKFTCSVGLFGGSGVSWADFEIPDAGASSASDNQISFLRGGQNTSDNQIAYLHGAVGTSDNQIAFTKGQSSSLDNQIAFTKGQSSQTDNQPTYLAGLTNVSDNQIAYLEGTAIADASDNAPAYLSGTGATSTSDIPSYINPLSYFPFQDNFTGTDDTSWNTTKWITEVAS